MVSLTTKDELRDFEAYLEPDFEASQFANDLILATNDNEDTELDLTTSIKRLKFDIDECDKRMKVISSNNHESLITNFTKIEDVRSVLKNEINPLIERVNTSFDRIKTDVMKPYDDALRMNNAMKRIHATLNLFRGSTYFIFLIQQLQESEKSYDNADESSNGHKEVIRLAKLHDQLSQFYDKEKKGSKSNQFNNDNINTNILSIKLIRDYQSIQLNKKTSLISDLNRSILKDLDHHTSFSVTNRNLQNNLIALYILNKNDFYHIIEKSSIGKQVQISLTHLTRTLQSPRNLTSVIKDVQETSATYTNTMNEILTKCDISNLDKSESKAVNNDSVNQGYIKEESYKNLLNAIENRFQSKSISQIYWTELSYKFKKNIVATMARGGPIAKNLRVYQTAIKNSIDDSFEPYERDLLNEAIGIIGGRFNK